MLLYGPLVDQYDFEHSGKDDTGLGRWVVTVFHGSKQSPTAIGKQLYYCQWQRRIIGVWGGVSYFIDEDDNNSVKTR